MKVDICKLREQIGDNPDQKKMKMSKSVHCMYDVHTSKHLKACVTFLCIPALHPLPWSVVTPRVSRFCLFLPCIPKNVPAQTVFRPDDPV